MTRFKRRRVESLPRHEQLAEQTVAPILDLVEGAVTHPGEPVDIGVDLGGRPAPDESVAVHVVASGLEGVAAVGEQGGVRHLLVGDVVRRLDQVGHSLLGSVGSAPVPPPHGTDGEDQSDGGGDGAEGPTGHRRSTDPAHRVRRPR